MKLSLNPIDMPGWNLSTVESLFSTANCNITYASQCRRSHNHSKPKKSRSAYADVVKDAGKKNKSITPVTDSTPFPFFLTPPRPLESCNIW